MLPVLLAVATTTALVLGFLYLARPSPAELGAFRVIVSDDTGKAGNTVHVTVAEAPYAALALLLVVLLGPTGCSRRAADAQASPTSSGTPAANAAGLGTENQPP